VVLEPLIVETPLQFFVGTAAGIARRLDEAD